MILESALLNINDMPLVGFKIVAVVHLSLFYIVNLFIKYY